MTTRWHNTILVCVGAPTEWRTASRSAKRLLGKLKKVNLAGKYGFAFDTKYASRLSGSAAHLIEKELKNRGIQIIAPHESAIVAGRMGGAILLEEGEADRFKRIGERIGATLAAKGTITPA